jgi:hypothetical protein
MQAITIFEKEKRRLRRRFSRPISLSINFVIAGKQSATRNPLNNVNHHS